MKIKNNYIKITTADGLEEVMEYKGESWYKKHPHSIVFNITDIASLMSPRSGSQRIYISKGIHNISITVSPKTYKKIEELVFEEK